MTSAACPPRPSHPRALPARPARPQWMRGRAYCPESRLDQLVTCLARSDSEQACGGVASGGGSSGPGSAATPPPPPTGDWPCVWTDQTLLRPLSLPASAAAFDMAVDGPARLMTAMADALIANFAFSYRIRGAFSEWFVPVCPFAPLVRQRSATRDTGPGSLHCQVPYCQVPNCQVPYAASCWEHLVACFPPC